MDTLTKKISGNISSHTTLENFQTNKYRGHLATPLPPQYISRWTATGGEGLGDAEADQVTPTDPPPATIILPREYHHHPTCLYKSHETTTPGLDIPLATPLTTLSLPQAAPKRKPTGTNTSTILTDHSGRG
ncbi:hypothetical protein Pcinc_023279 [Petrolisthes cinctipes]|uniref:Uncharacterized protein n=1 Tax=Petrolisthes cinctipes TaxID=88211 RepID=A0AAE1FEM2_PETCI|nr:hypothetical protein Pcinc_023279 [Petrolisthes cinctipes]